MSSSGSSFSSTSPSSTPSTSDSPSHSPVCPLQPRTSAISASSHSSAPPATSSPNPVPLQLTVSDAQRHEGFNQTNITTEDVSEDLEDEDEDEDGAQYAAPMNDPFAEVEHGWRRMSESAANHSRISPGRPPLSDAQQRPARASRNDEVLDQLSGFSFATIPASNQARAKPIPHPSLLPQSAPRKFSLPHTTQGNPKLKLAPSAMNLCMRRSDQIGLFRPPTSALASKTSFSSGELTVNSSTHHSRGRLSSFSSELEPISASPTSPNSPFCLSTAQTAPPPAPRASLPTPPWRNAPLSSSSSSSFCSSDDGLLLRRGSSSSLASVGSVSSSTTNGLKARRGLTKPLSLAVPHGNHTSLAPIVATPIRPMAEPQARATTFSRSLPPSPRHSTLELDHSRAQIVGMKANVTGGLSMKRRTSIPRLSLGGISSQDPARPYDPIQLVGRNPERSVVNTPVQLHFDPVAAGEGRQELMSSQAGVGGKGHIERPEELTEAYPYEHGPREVLPDVYLGSEQNARDGKLLSSMGFGLIINVAKEVECPWEAATVHTPNEHDRSSPGSRGLLVRPTASTPNLKRSFEGKIRVNLPVTSPVQTPIQVKKLSADRASARPSLDYIKLPWSHDQDGLSEIFSSSEVFSLIDKARERGLKTLIHCQCGVSRSATLMIGYCMREAVLKPQDTCQDGRMHEAYSFVKEKSPWAGPNMGLIYQLIEYEKVLMKKKGRILEEDEEDDDDMRDTIMMTPSDENGLRTPTM